ncbi:TetR/AcrR family transcriptional regulator [Planococcus versutus]|uniref:TetR family transcriptional regulator n=1 Tax=Planococcus versutus TaxID=1302659 RepID=A0A1B1RX11_9BACL|nr:TetR/AcrR family transcriptional regulator [Planococcus versutus]ANU25477.1 TetR family transcriptional regulator [Planococcus versutus]
MRKISPGERRIMRRSYTVKIIDTIRIEGFLTLTIQDLAYLMGISRASLYNFFASKEDIILELTEIYIEYITRTNEFISNPRYSYKQRLPAVFEQTVFCAVYSSEIYLSQLKCTCPELYEQILNLTKKRMATLHAFYENGMSDGDFTSLNSLLIIEQDEAALESILNSTFLVDKGILLENSMYDYYEIMKYRCFTKPSIDPGKDPYIDKAVRVIVEQLSKNKKISARKNSR